MVAVRAITKQAGVSQKHLMPLFDLVRGKGVDNAIDILEFSTSPWAKVIAMTVRSAAANAENNMLMDRERLKIVNIRADGARPMRRVRPHAKGRTGRMRRRACHITVVVDEEAA